MARSSGSLQLLFLLLLLFSFNSGGYLKFARGLEVQNRWCVAKPSASDSDLQSNIDFACNNLKDCRSIQPGGPCYNPVTQISHASVAMNQYYASMGRNPWNCDFSGSALIVVTDPSYSGCKYA